MITPDRVSRTLEAMAALEAVKPNEFMGIVYRFTHIANGGSCLHVHGDWEKEFLEAEKEMIEAYYTSPTERRERAAKAQGETK